ncbi:MerR family transcriptional regulator [Nonomuraea indica]|uniref:MerR family transcriptional regulator n=1 Tax=Nonomuraea indica TaxID=1581193 RepID=UPI000C7B15D1|nr:MerR family transcriptional regulator [Nonomuraea indica]
MTRKSAIGDVRVEEIGPVTTGEEPGYGIGAVSRLLGVPAPTLRTWNLRYGIGPSRRSPGGHRRYDRADLARLEEMNRLIHAGVPPADAARQALRLTVPSETAPSRTEATPPGALSPATTPPGTTPTETTPTGTTPPKTPAAQTTPHRATTPATASPQPAPSGLVRAGRGELGPHVPSAAMLARSAHALDGRAVADGLAAALTRLGVAGTWDRLVRPVFATICRRQEETGAGVEVEHLFSDRLLAALLPLAARPERPVNQRPVLLACAEDEQHSLPVHALAAVLAGERDVDCRVLGARTPYPALADAMRRLGPAVVFVWSQRAATGDPAPLAALPVSRPPARIVVGGPGWGPGLPPKVVRVDSLPDAVARIVATLH